jgi:hypothetical protein
LTSSLRQVAMCELASQRKSGVATKVPTARTAAQCSRCQQAVAADGALPSPHMVRTGVSGVGAPFSRRWWVSQGVRGDVERGT